LLRTIFFQQILEEVFRMKKGSKKRAIALIAMGFALIFMSTSSIAADWPEKKVEWSIISGPEGSLGYVTTTILAKILTDNIKNFAAYPQAGGTVKGLRQMAAGNVMMTYGNTASLEQVYLDRGPFEKQPIKGMKAQIGLPLLPFTFFMVAKKDSGIYTMDDLVGKSITISTPTYGIFTPAYDAMNTIGLWNRIKHKDVSFADYAGAITGGVVDAMMVYIISDVTTSGAIKNVEARIDMRAVTFTENQKKMIRSLPGIGFRDTKNIFPEIERKTIGGWSYYYGWYFSPKANDKLVYEIVKTCYEKRVELAKASIAFGPWEAEPKELLKAAFSVTPDVPHHPGAIKFYEEFGVK